MATTKETTGGFNANTVIGESILINGKLSGDEDLTVRGRVEGTLTLTRTLIVEPSGIVKADVAVRNAIVSGVVVGNINATESVELTREGRMVGDIRSPRVIIVDGASFRGRVDMGEVEPGRVTASARDARPTVRPTVRPAAAPPRPPSPPVRATTSAPTRVESRPTPPPPPGKTEAVRPPAPPAPPVMAAAAKKKVIVKKKGK
jgi:cytoskeletal protein CcmA (bactofilin family)